jgi:hypothetical protein
VPCSAPKCHPIREREHNRGDILCMLLYSTRSDCRRQLLFNCVVLALAFHQGQSSHSAYSQAAFQNVSHSGNIGDESMQAFSYSHCDTHHRRPVSLLTWKFSQKQCATPTRDCLPTRVGIPHLGVSCYQGLSEPWAYHLLELPQRREVLVREHQSAAAGFDNDMRGT